MLQDVAACHLVSCGIAPKRKVRPWSWTPIPGRTLTAWDESSDALSLMNFELWTLMKADESWLKADESWWKLMKVRSAPFDRGLTKSMTFPEVCTQFPTLQPQLLQNFYLLGKSTEVWPPRAPAQQNKGSAPKPALPWARHSKMSTPIWWNQASFSHYQWCISLFLHLYTHIHTYVYI